MSDDDDPIDRRNPIGVASFLAAIGAIVLPVALAEYTKLEFGWVWVVIIVLLATGLVLGILATTRSGRSKWAGISGIAISALGLALASVIGMLVLLGAH